MFYLKHDNEFKAQAETINELLIKKMPDGYSWDHAFKHEGWYIVNDKGEIVEGKKNTTLPF